MVWPICFNSALDLGNLDSCVAICTLWTQKEEILKDIPKDNFIVAGQLYSIQGINHLIRNTLANPKIRYLVVCGNDLSGSGKALLNIIKTGKADGFVHEIEERFIKIFCNNIILIDLGGENNSIKILNEIKKLAYLPPNRDPIIIEEKRPKFLDWGVESSGFIVRAPTISEAWLNILDLILKVGEEKQCEYPGKQKEIANLVSVIEGDNQPIESWLGFSKEDVEKYCQSLLSKEKPEGVAYTYGERLFAYSFTNSNEKREAVNQIDKIIEYIKITPHTRRATASTWSVEIDSKSDHPPCLTQISVLVKYGKIYLTAIIRSNDMFGAWPLNAFGLLALQQKIAIETGYKIGHLTIISISAHIYENKWGESEKILRAYHKKTIPFTIDPLGYFIINVKDKIEIQHYTTKDQKTQYFFVGDNAEEMIKHIIAANIISKLSHAAYLSRELHKAEVALKNNTKYIQDA